MKLTHQQAIQIVIKVRNDIKKCPSYRLGQGIYNELREYSEIEKKLFKTENDFFYWIDEEKVLECFYRECVENN